MELPKPTHLCLSSCVAILATLVALHGLNSSSAAASAAADFSALVYKGCSRQTSEGNPDFQRSVAALFDSLISQSSTSHFSKASSGSGQSAVAGLFQCRGDLSPAACSACLRAIPALSASLCGAAVAARVQLAGCYAAYQAAGFPKIPGTQLLYKICSQAEAGFEEKRDTAFLAVETGIAGGSGFYAATYASVYVVAQCEGDLSAGDCGMCVRDAVQKAEVECGRSVAGQIYLNRCYLSYSYYPNGFTGHSSLGSQQQTGKTVAIVVGGAAALFFGVICLLFIRSLWKKRDGKAQK